MGHGGNIRELTEKMGIAPSELLDFSANINPLGHPEMVNADLLRSSTDLVHYPDIQNKKLLQAAALHYGVSESEVLAGNGSNDLLYALYRALRPQRVILPVPCYRDYIEGAQASKLALEFLPLDEAEHFKVDFDILRKKVLPGDLVVLGRPNNPTGLGFEEGELYEFCQSSPQVMVVVDEAFIDLTKRKPLALLYPNLLLLRSLTKNYALPGLRLGLLLGKEEHLLKIKGELVPWSVNTLAQNVGAKLFSEKDFLEESRSYIEKQRKLMIKRLSALSALKVFMGEANFLLIKVIDPSWTVEKLQGELALKKIAIRPCENYIGLDSSYFRIAVKHEEANEFLLQSFEEILENKVSSSKIKKKTPSLMFQGTCSDAGKSILTAAFCRILKQDGIQVAPFKAQNMSLNSYVTYDGKEMGRAQVTQAYAAKIRPDVRMNPVLLKPNSQTGSQVIIKGKSIGNRDTIGYIDYKKIAFEAVKESYDSLASEYDAIILEGAGSPGEINLKKHDIVNMRMAQYAKSPVLLVGDIDRGGVFASFIGSFCTFAPWERELLKGFVINKFRGNRALLGPAFEMIERYTGKEIWGTVDHLKGLIIPDEDSVRFKETKSGKELSSNEKIKIAFIDLPHISNATDLDPLLLEEDVEVTIVRTGGELKGLDLVIIPGSKNVIADLEWLKNSGLASEILTFAHNGGAVLGICGGFQILGTTIEDPHALEGKISKAEALGLLSAHTILQKEKTLKQTRASHVNSQIKLEGYEIHHGETTVHEASLWLKGENEEDLGFQSKKSFICGTYLHGLFEADLFRRQFLNELRQAKGLTPLESHALYDVDKSLNILADHVRANFDMKRVYQLMGL